MSVYKLMSVDGNDFSASSTLCKSAKNSFGSPFGIAVFARSDMLLSTRPSFCTSGSFSLVKTLFSETALASDVVLEFDIVVEVDDCVFAHAQTLNVATIRRVVLIFLESIC